MTIRPFQESDREALKAMALEAGYPYPEPDGPLIESCLVVVDDNEQVVAAIAAQRIVELYLWKRGVLTPAMSLAILKVMHSEMATELRKLGYDECNAFLPPSICGKFGRRLKRSFGWTSNWPSLCIRF
jgi:hypothetical protein